MTVTIFPKKDAIKFAPAGAGDVLLKHVSESGRMPPVSLMIRPLAESGGSLVSQMSSAPIYLDRFLSYSFTSSILIPVDTFSFTLAAPDGPPVSDLVNEGDVVSIFANDIPIATGIIDQTQIQIDPNSGEQATLSGRDLMAQLEDQDAISLDSTPMFANSLPIASVVTRLISDTRITKYELRGAPSRSYLFATEPGESKLAALQRFLEPLNCVAWMGPTGHVIVGKPDMSSEPVGKIYVRKADRQSNALSMSVTRAAATIPNVIVPVWSGQELTVDRVGKQQRLNNAAKGPSRLFKLGHRLPKTVVVSTPQATDPQGLSAVNAIAAGGGDLLQSYAKRELARANVAEMIVQAVVPSHFNEHGEPYVTDTVYHVEYDRGGVDELMYLFQCDYDMTAESGQRTNLYFCRLGTIVSDVKAP